MSKIVLLHGFAVHLTAPLIRPPLGPAASFEIFKDEVESGEATVFPWGIEKHVSLFRLLDPVFILNFYRAEKRIVEDLETLQRLKNFLDVEEPEEIICHSMGCYLLNNFCKKFPLPESVKRIVFIQADDISVRLPLPLINVYCFWDPTLLISILLNGKIRVGLIPDRQDSVKNIFWPLFLPINLHTSTLRDRRFADFLRQH